MAAAAESLFFQGKPDVTNHPRVSQEAMNEGCCKKSQYYMLSQNVAVVRHADRLDHTKEWQDYPFRDAWPYDTPITEEGRKNAESVGDMLNKKSLFFDLIVASPYLRCAQTASAMAQKMKLPVTFDLDLGEVFDKVYMPKNVDGTAQHRDPAKLDAILKKEYPDVTYSREADGALKIGGVLPNYPEPFSAARMRYCYKAQRIMQHSAAKCMSVVIVTHADALPAVCSFIRSTMQITKVPYAGYFVASRKVKVQKVGAPDALPEQPAYIESEWKVILSPGVMTKEAPQQEQLQREQQMAKMQSRYKGVLTAKFTGVFSAEGKKDEEEFKKQAEEAKKGLKGLNVNDKDAKQLTMKMKNNAVFKEETRLDRSPLRT